MHVLGVDIGGTTIKLGVIDVATGDIASESFFSTPQTGSHGVALAIADHIHNLQHSYPELDRMGVGVPGAMNRDRSLVRYPPNLIGWKEEPLQQYLHEALPTFRRIEVDNDAKVATLAEAHLGAGRGTSHFLLVTLGTGVGGGIYCSEGAFVGLYRGASGGAGEFGHMSIALHGPHCNCGSRGCIEAYIGQNYLSQRVKETLLANPLIQTTLRPVINELSPRIIASAMDAGDTFAKSVFEEAGTLLGIALSNVAKLLDMHTFIIGGGVAEAGAVLFEAARTSLQANVFENLKPVVEIRKAAFGNRAGIVGAAMLVID